VPARESKIPVKEPKGIDKRAIGSLLAIIKVLGELHPFLCQRVNLNVECNHSNRIQCKSIHQILKIYRDDDDDDYDDDYDDNYDDDYDDDYDMMIK